jgi:hypothetical protein
LAHRPDDDGSLPDLRDPATWIGNNGASVEEDPGISCFRREYCRQFHDENRDAKADLGARQQQQE